MFEAEAVHGEKEVMVEVNAEEVYGEEVEAGVPIEEEDEVEDMDGTQVRHKTHKEEWQHMEIKYRTMMDNISVPWF